MLPQGPPPAHLVWVGKTGPPKQQAAPHGLLGSASLGCQGCLCFSGDVWLASGGSAASSTSWCNLGDISSCGRGGYASLSCLRDRSTRTLPRLKDYACWRT